MESVQRFESIERARNAAIQWLQQRSVVFGPHRRVEIGRLGVLAGKEVGVRASQEPFWRIRLDYDPTKGAHFNAEVGRGPNRVKAAFCFPGGEELISTLAESRSPR